MLQRTEYISFPYCARVARVERGKHITDLVALPDGFSASYHTSHLSDPFKWGHRLGEKGRKQAILCLPEWCSERHYLLPVTPKAGLQTYPHTDATLGTDIHLAHMFFTIRCRSKFHTG